MSEEKNKINGMLKKKILISGSIESKTGLHVGGTNTGLSIGGADATVVRNPVNNEPYIPGSSLKGKMRSLLEKLEGAFGPGIDKNVKTGPYTSFDNSDTEGKKLIVKIFGTMPDKMKDIIEPTSRIIVRDCNLLNADELEKLQNTDMPFTEVKTEVVIDRITSAATPRSIERVPSGAKFCLNIILNVFDGDKEETMINKVFESLILVQNDYLGGKGTRGSGEVKISIDQLKYKDKTIYESNGVWNQYTNGITVPDDLKPEEK